MICSRIIWLTLLLYIAEYYLIISKPFDNRACEPGGIFRLRPGTVTEILTKYSTILSIVGPIMITVKYYKTDDEKS